MKDMPFVHSMQIFLNTMIVVNVISSFTRETYKTDPIIIFHKMAVDVSESRRTTFFQHDIIKINRSEETHKISVTNQKPRNSKNDLQHTAFPLKKTIFFET